MRSFLPAYEMLAPKTLQDALAILGREPGAWQLFAGGTDLMVLLEAAKLPQKKFLSIWRLPELTGIEEAPEHVTLGALTTYSDVRANATLQREFGMLCRAAEETGGIAIQNRGTIGGNIANGSPAADSPPALLAYDAELELVSASGSRWTPYHGFHTGYKTSILRAGELIRRIRLPRTRQPWREYYRKVGTRKAQAISKVCFAARARVESGRIAEIRIALGAVAPTVLRCVQTEAVLAGRIADEAAITAAVEQLAREISPIDDMRSTAAYRRRVACNLLADFLGKLYL